MLHHQTTSFQISLKISIKGFDLIHRIKAKILQYSILKNQKQND